VFEVDLGRNLLLDIEKQYVGIIAYIKKFGGINKNFVKSHEIGNF